MARDDVDAISPKYPFRNLYPRCLARCVTTGELRERQGSDRDLAVCTLMLQSGGMARRFRITFVRVPPDSSLINCLSAVPRDEAGVQRPSQKHSFVVRRPALDVYMSCDSQLSYQAKEKPFWSSCGTLKTFFLAFSPPVFSGATTMYLSMIGWPHRKSFRADSFGENWLCDNISACPWCAPCSPAGGSHRPILLTAVV